MVFKAHIDSLHGMLSYIRGMAEQCGFAESDCSFLEIAVEEALVNIIKHGYPSDASGSIVIEAMQVDDKPGFKLVIKDQGVAYNPLKDVKPRDFEAPLDVLQPGGYGVLLILKIMDEAHYERIEDHNVLTLVKYKIKSL